MERAPFVTIGMPCFNEADYIEACVRAVLQQEYPRDRFEVIVADGGSSDGTRAILERLAAGQPLVSDDTALCEPVNGGVCVHGRARAAVLDTLGTPNSKAACSARCWSASSRPKRSAGR